MDAQIGRIRRVPRRRAMRKDTLIVFTIDHGILLGRSPNDGGDRTTQLSRPRSGRMMRKGFFTALCGSRFPFHALPGLTPPRKMRIAAVHVRKGSTASTSPRCPILRRTHNVEFSLPLTPRILALACKGPKSTRGAAHQGLVHLSRLVPPSPASSCSHDRYSPLCLFLHTLLHRRIDRSPGAFRRTSARACCTARLSLSREFRHGMGRPTSPSHRCPAVSCITRPRWPACCSVREPRSRARVTQ